MSLKWNDYTDFSFLKSAPPLPVSFTHPVLATLHPSLPPCLISLPVPFLHPLPFIFLSLRFSLFHLKISSFLSMYHPPFLHICTLPVECLCVCHYAGRGRLCTQRFVCSGSQSLLTAASSIIECNGTFTFYSWATLGSLLSVRRFPCCRW